MGYTIHPVIKPHKADTGRVAAVVQEEGPVWQAMPPTCSILSNTTSLSQSVRISSTFWKWPDSSPLCQSLRRERDQ